ncbi:glutathione transferase GstA [Ollibium composti]|uniref:Glutathione transferase GstA n=1 Tax=Ollibium composti TaxID=2675109 RepID=A0ABY2Q8B7_9HYPH|nr:glutathione transferase GstA [Mesorhizobium composti]THF58009.1 glutathione transferase GstA [Mesorhizobium composti]
MKLYYSPGACSLAPHIVASEAGLDLDLVRVDLASKKTEGGDDFLKVNPNGYVPTLVTGAAEPVTEASVVVQYLADQKPEAGLMPKSGDPARYRIQQWLAFISTELHKTFSPFFKPTTPDATKEANRALLSKRLGYVETELANGPYLTGNTFTAADAYLWTVLGWSKAVNFDLSSFPNVQRFMATVASRPAVRKALQEEGLA